MCLNIAKFSRLLFRPETDLVQFLYVYIVNNKRCYYFSSTCIHQSLLSLILVDLFELLNAYKQLF